MTKRKPNLTPPVIGRRYFHRHRSSQAGRDVVAYDAKTQTVTVKHAGLNFTNNRLVISGQDEAELSLEVFNRFWK